MRTLRTLTPFRELQQSVGDFTVSSYLTGTMAISATKDGDMIFWDTPALADANTSPTDKRAVKIIRFGVGVAAR
jgi:hypothetical protein